MPLPATAATLPHSKERQTTSPARQRTLEHCPRPAALRSDRDHHSRLTTPARACITNASHCSDRGGPMASDSTSTFDDYPVRVDIEYPSGGHRWMILIRWLLAIPNFMALIFCGLVIALFSELPWIII